MINNLKSALTAFMEDMWIPFEDSLGIIDHEFSSEKKENLKTEFIEATVNQDFDWLRLAKDTLLLIEPESYSNLEIKNYVKFLLQDYLFPEQKISNEAINALKNIIINIFHQKPDNWIYSYDLYNFIIKEEAFKDIDYYNLWKIPFQKLNIERKPIESKEREIGFLKLVQ
ncbi:hypothetical protein AD998_20315 [bacterium 336/3]|nr:hypothetical protein AD998_20315 [bacterium 336/3]